VRLLDFNAMSKDQSRPKGNQGRRRTSVCFLLLFFPGLVAVESRARAQASTIGSPDASTLQSTGGPANLSLKITLHEALERAKAMSPLGTDASQELTAPATIL
jgi:hypothetical protein